MNCEDLIETNNNVRNNKKSLSNYFDLTDKPSITSPEALKQKSKGEIDNIALESTNVITEEEVDILLILIKNEACGILMNEEAPDCFNAIHKKVYKHHESLSFTDMTLKLKIQTEHKTPTPHSISKERLAIQKSIWKRWIPACYRNYEYLTFVSN